jgi:hypothetical protein
MSHLLIGKYQCSATAKRHMRSLQVVPAVSIKLVKMMDRAMAATNIEAIGGCDRGTDPGLGMTDRGFQFLALRKASCDGRGQ